MKKNLIIDHLFRLLYVVRNAACHRALSKYEGEFKQNYWILIYNNFLDIAILEWCKVFGSDNEPTHWKTCVDDHDSFRQGLLTALGIDNSTWDAYWKSVKSYRDNLVAHHQKNPDVTHYPRLDNFLTSSFYYYSWLISKLRSLGIDNYPDDLKEYYNRFLSQASNFAEVSYQATNEIEEQVY